MGTLLAYSALGVSKVAIAAPSAEAKGRDDGTPLGPQALVLRRFEIVSGTLGETMDAFAKFCGISVKFAEAELRTLPSKGVMGLYTLDQALKLLVADSGWRRWRRPWRFRLTVRK